MTSERTASRRYGLRRLEPSLTGDSSTSPAPPPENRASPSDASMTIMPSTGSVAASRRASLRAYPTCLKILVDTGSGEAEPCPQSGHSPNGSLKLIGLLPAYAYRLTPPASPMGSWVRKRRFGPEHGPPSGPVYDSRGPGASGSSGPTRAAGWARRYTSRRPVSDTCAYSAVVESWLWPSKAWM